MIIHDQPAFRNLEIPFAKRGKICWCVIFALRAKITHQQVILFKFRIADEQPAFPLIRDMKRILKPFRISNCWSMIISICSDWSSIGNRLMYCIKLYGILIDREKAAISVYDIGNKFFFIIWVWFERSIHISNNNSKFEKNFWNKRGKLSLCSFCAPR